MSPRDGPERATRRLVRGQRCVVTGSTSGIGEATARALAARGAQVVMVARDLERAHAAAARIRSDVPTADVAIEIGDLASLRSTRALVARLSTGAPIDVLVLDAGTTTDRREVTEDGFERILAVNFLVGSFALAVPLSAHMPRGARIVQLAGIYHRRGQLDPSDLQYARRAWSMDAANAQAQLARIVFVAELADRLSRRGVTVNAVHPGAVLTTAQRHAPLWARVLIHTVARPAFVRPDRGAEPVVRLCTAAELAAVTGRFFDRAREAALPPAALDRTVRASLWEQASLLTGAQLGEPLADFARAHSAATPGTAVEGV